MNLELGRGFDPAVKTKSKINKFYCVFSVLKAESPETTNTTVVVGSKGQILGMRAEIAGLSQIGTQRVSQELWLLPAPVVRNFENDCRDIQTPLLTRDELMTKQSSTAYCRVIRSQWLR